MRSVPPPKKGVIRRLTERLKKSDEFTPMPDFPVKKCSEVPERLQLDCSAKWIGKKKPKIQKKLSVFLQDGQLELRDRSKTEIIGLSSGFIVDLAKVQVLADERRVIIKLQGDEQTIVLTPLDQQTVDRFKELIQKHRLFRQEVVQREQLKTETKTKTTVITETCSTTTMSDDFRGWDYDPNWLKVFDSVKEMQTVTVTVLEKLKKCLEEMRTALGDLRTITGKPSLVSNVVSCVNTHPTNHVQTPQLVTDANRKEDDDSEEEESEELDANTEKELLTPLPLNQNMLKSLEAARDDAEEQSKRDMLTRCRKILDKSKAESKLSPKPASPILSLFSKKEKKEETKTVVTQKKVRRELLPSPQLPCEGIGIKVLCQLIVNKVGMPLTNYEPIGFVQAACEELVWSSLLDNAAASKHPEERMSLVTAFAVSSYITKVGRNRKPFNPILGETFDYEETSWKFHGEQVSHHPPISAGYAESKNWAFWITFHLVTSTSKLSRSCELSVAEPLRIKLKLADGTTEDYAWNKVKTKIENLTAAPEQRKVSHDGLLLVRSTSNYIGRVYFKKTKNPTELIGDVMNSKDVISYRLHGFWDKNFVRIRTTGEIETLLNEHQLTRYPDYFGFNSFTMGLNEMDVGLPASDSRNRQDMRALEHGNIPLAAHFKKQLEDLQRAKIKTSPHTPLWFDLVTDEMTKKQVYYPNGKYWSAKQSAFADIADIVSTSCSN